MSGRASLELPEPEVPTLRKAPRRFESESTPHHFSSPEEYYRRMYYEILDCTITSLNERFQCESMDFLKKIENFLIKKSEEDEEEHCTDSDSHVDNVDEIISFYKEDGFEKNRLILHRNMFIDLFVEKKGRKPKDASDIIVFARENVHLQELMSQMFRLIRILLTIPCTTVTCERSFSALRRLKTYLRSLLLAERLNHIAILHIYRNIVQNMDLDPIIKKWILKNRMREATFALNL